ncbi:hypothetical protein ISCGN_007416 [Ixodes scapularis]
MPFCSVGGFFTKREDGKRLLRFPLGSKDQHRLRVWLELVERENFEPTARSRVSTTARQRTTFPEVMSEECILMELLTVEVEMPASPESTNVPKLMKTSHCLWMKEAPCNGDQCIHQATIAELLRKLDLAQKRIRKLERELEAVIGDFINDAFLKDLVLSVIRKREDAGCYVDAVIWDVGPSTKALWKKRGISPSGQQRL